jgi:hypothetical protein
MSRVRESAPLIRDSRRGFPRRAIVSRDRVNATAKAAPTNPPTRKLT